VSYFGSPLAYTAHLKRPEPGRSHRRKSALFWREQGEEGYVPASRLDDFFPLLPAVGVQSEAHLESIFELNGRLPKLTFLHRHLKRLRSRKNGKVP
jgi:hypothetical protein